MDKPQSIAVVIAVYKDVKSLELIIDSLLHQTRLPDEIIVAEDGEDAGIKKCLDSFDSPIIKHTSHEDKGWQRNKSVNNALRIVQSDYIVFLDGDCIPYPDYIAGTYALCEPKSVLCGRRSEPGEFYSTRIRDKELSVRDFIRSYIWDYFKLKKDHIRHYEEGLSVDPGGVLYGVFSKFSRKDSHIVGCNWSAWRSDLEMINGFDEDFVLPTTGEDTDLERRLRHFGVKMKSCRNVANVIHLYHTKVFNPEITAQTEQMMRDKSDQFICTHGLKNLDNDSQ